MEEYDTVLEEKYRQFEETVKKNVPSANLSHVREAFDFARLAHGDQKRKDGTPFITHPLAAAEIIAEMSLDEESIIAALLHDTVEDTGITHEDIEKKFGTEVAELVEGVTKLTRVTYSNKEDEQMENLRKMLIAMAKDIRVILIKLADRLHNMRTLEYQSEEKQREKALETMEIYAPIAHRLGMQKIKWELEDLSIMRLDPEGYAYISKEVEKRNSENEQFFESIKKRITERLEEYGIEASVYGRIKHIYSIYRKMYSQNKTFDEVLDLYAFRVIVDTIADCYNVLGHIHDMFRPIPGHFKDYIGTPKPNMYQSLHTTVIGTEGIPFEVQIRTWEMHETAEYGIAAHWKYKQGIQGNADEEKFSWIRRLLESQQDSDAQDFVQSLKIDMFSDEVFVFTPQGDVINLPAGATPIDFAYNIHSAIGNRMTAAKVNGRIVPFTTILKNGDIVEVITSNASKGPSRDWLGIVKSGAARTKIRQWFKKERRDENIVHGKAAFESELRRAMISMSDITADDVLPRVLKRLSFPSLEEVYAAIGYGGISAQKTVNRIKDELLTIERAKKKAETDGITPTSQQAEPTARPVHGVVIEGVDNCLVKFAHCCTPIPGDEIAGFITRGFGISIHRRDCKNYLSSIEKPDERPRWLNVQWANSASDVYQTSVFITAKDRTGLIMDVAMVLSTLNVKTSAFSARKVADGNAVLSMTLDLRDRRELDATMARLNAVPGVITVKRGAN
ncbi:MAG: bifunctional (p)ppGpp synthetase/guanosine-3',5'-bis(diphosphate) 3'-pyrophosphohydrolase [Oscillospiraceae bacterium]|nr:bifunctional (p)ppGpp synthetase/guanosine-3',5'-bis(diphosphate) 3'-pyrophosphohydrolase [Oscillospiraceae bacterium]